MFIHIYRILFGIRKLFRRYLYLFIIYSWNRIPFKDNLFRWDIIQQDSHLCVRVYDTLESENHLFLGCHYFGCIWYLVRNWVYISSVDPFCVLEHFVQFGQSGGYSKYRRSLMQLIWLSCVWVIWKEKNNRILNHKEDSMQHLLDKIKLLSYQWMKEKIINFAFGYHNWQSFNLYGHWKLLVFYLDTPCDR